MTIRDRLGTMYTDEQFQDLFPGRGQPAESPARLALVIELQFMEGLTDRQTADAVRGRIDWKYTLSTPGVKGSFGILMIRRVEVSPRIKTEIPGYGIAQEPITRCQTYQM